MKIVEIAASGSISPATETHSESASKPGPPSTRSPTKMEMSGERAAASSMHAAKAPGSSPDVVRSPMTAILTEDSRASRRIRIAMGLLR